MQIPSNKQTVIFLDIDGVLVSYLYLKDRHLDGYHKFVDSAVSALNVLLNVTNADICISSTWRKGKSIELLQSIFDNRNVNGKIIGKTPDFGGRGEEILNWYNNQTDYNNYIIIDDEWCDIEPYIKYNYKKEIRTNPFRCLDLYDIVNFVDRRTMLKLIENSNT